MLRVKSDKRLTRAAVRFMNTQARFTNAARSGSRPARPASPAMGA